MSARRRNRPRRRLRVREIHVELTTAERARLSSAAQPINADMRKTLRTDWRNPFHVGIRDVMRGPIRDMAHNGSPHWVDVASDQWLQLQHEMKARINRALNKVGEQTVAKEARLEARRARKAMRAG